MSLKLVTYWLHAGDMRELCHSSLANADAEAERAEADDGTLEESVAGYDRPHAFRHGQGSGADGLLQRKCFHMTINERIVETIPLHLQYSLTLIHGAGAFGILWAGVVGLI
jgi:hypothetical protein